MSKPSRRPTREARKKDRQQKNEARKELRRRQTEAGLEVPKKTTILNGKSTLETPQQEQEDRQKTVEEQLKVWPQYITPSAYASGLDQRPAEPKNNQAQTYGYPVVWAPDLYLPFVFAPGGQPKVKFTDVSGKSPTAFSGTGDNAPADTLDRLLCRINVDQIEESLVDLVRGLIRNKKFQNFLVGKNYCIAVDGTRKFKRDYYWAEECLERTVAFKRLAKRLKHHFPRLPITLLLDGLFDNALPA